MLAPVNHRGLSMLLTMKLGPSESPLPLLSYLLSPPYHGQMVITRLCHHPLDLRKLISALPLRRFEPPGIRYTNAICALTFSCIQRAKDNKMIKSTIPDSIMVLLGSHSMVSGLINMSGHSFPFVHVALIKRDFINVPNHYLND